MTKKIAAVFVLFIITLTATAQINQPDELPALDFAKPKEYEIGGITVSGPKHLDKSVLIALSGLSVGDKIKVPGDDVSRAIEKLWKQGLFSDININIDKIVGNKIFIELELQERPRLSKFSFVGIKKSDSDDIRDKIKLIKGKVVTDNLLMTTKNTVRDFYIEKGFLNVEVKTVEKPDTTLANHVIIDIHINKKKKIKIHQINIIGSKEVKDSKLKKAMKDTKEMKWYRIFSSSKFLEKNYKTDKIKLIEKYNQNGFRDARITKDSIYKFDEKSINIDIHVEEGVKYYFRNITWVGNTKHSSETLSNILGIKKGAVYNQAEFESNLFMNPNGRDVSSLYLDDGYLFFQVTPVEVLVENDSIDIEMRVYEGKQAIISKVIITGNTKTNDHVILREIRTKPGQLFSRSDIIRSQRELAQLGYFDQEKLAVDPKPNPAEGTVDIEYKVEEKPSDQVELSGGWGAGRLVGTLGVSFNNFSAKNIFKKGAWRPLPAGDGQKLSVRAQSNGIFFQSYNASFTEPWFLGKKPNALSVTLYNSRQTNGRPKKDEAHESIIITGLSVGLGKRLTFPDDYFTLYNEVNYQNYNLNNFRSTFSFTEGNSNTFSYKVIFSRNSVDAPIYPRYGSNNSLSVQFTPPYSVFSTLDYSTATEQEKYKWIEYHKWKFMSSWFTKLAGNLVLNTKVQFGFLGLYNRQVGLAPFERFYVGGDGLSGFALDGREIIALRGYQNNSLTPMNSSGNFIGGTIYNKYTLEMRYPISLNPSATLFGLAFLEAGQSWADFNTFNPFGVKRSAGMGLRIFLPMFGLLGLDWGYGFDPVPGLQTKSGGQFHFSIGQSIN